MRKEQEVILKVCEPRWFEKNGETKIINKKIKIKKGVPSELNTKEEIYEWIFDSEKNIARNVLSVKIKKPRYVID